VRPPSGATTSPQHLITQRGRFQRRADGTDARADQPDSWNHRTRGQVARNQVQPVPSTGAQPLHVHCKMRIDSSGRVSKEILHSLKPRFKGNPFRAIHANVSFGVWHQGSVVGGKATSRLASQSAGCRKRLTAIVDCCSHRLLSLVPEATGDHLGSCCNAKNERRPRAICRETFAEFNLVIPPSESTIERLQRRTQGQPARVWPRRKEGFPCLRNRSTSLHRKSALSRVMPIRA
jgi:hypothetical protein